MMVISKTYFRIPGGQVPCFKALFRSEVAEGLRQAAELVVMDIQGLQRREVVEGLRQAAGAGSHEGPKFLAP